MLQEIDSVTGDCQCYGRLTVLQETECYRRLTVLQETDSVTGD